MAPSVRRSRPGGQLGQRIRTVRGRLGLNQGRFAARVGVSSRNVVNDWEAGRAHPRAQTLDRIARLGGVTAEWLLHGNSRRTTRSPADAAWEEAVEALRIVWQEPSRREEVLSALRALRPPG
jgi:transcriptional regulator with XRE-family HTH domain